MDIYSKVDRLQKKVIGSPVWVENKQVFEYKVVDIKVVSILKAIRATQGVQSLYLLCENGLFIDMGAICRCVTDCIYEIYFLLEKYPEQSNNVKKFVAAFSETTIDGHLSPATEFPITKKIYSAAVRAITLSEQDQKVTDMLDRIYKTFCGYTHANYSHIMQIYGGDNWQNLSFNLSGVPSERQRLDHMKLVNEIAQTLSHVLDYMALKFNVTES